MLGGQYVVDVGNEACDRGKGYMGNATGLCIYVPGGSELFQMSIKSRIPGHSLYLLSAKAAP